MPPVDPPPDEVMAQLTGARRAVLEAMPRPEDCGYTYEVLAQLTGLTRSAALDDALWLEEHGLAEEVEPAAYRRTALGEAACWEPHPQPLSASGEGSPEAPAVAPVYDADGMFLGVDWARPGEESRTVQSLPGDWSPVRVCRVCGCTDDHACPGGCYWVEEDLCSACAELPARLRPAPVRRRTIWLGLIAGNSPQPQLFGERRDCPPAATAHHAQYLATKRKDCG